MSSAAVVLACALSLLGRSAHSMPPIELVDVPPIGVSPLAEAFVRHAERKIYLVTSSAVFQEALERDSRCGEIRAHKKIASILAHEEWHVLHGHDERAAYQKQLTTLIRLGVDPGSPIYGEVMRSMLKVTKAEKQSKVIVTARR